MSEARTVALGSREKKYILYSDDSFLLIDNRAVWVHMGLPYGGGLMREDGTKSPPKFSLILLLKKGDPVDEKKKTLLERVIKKVLDDKNSGNDIKSDKKFLRDGDQEGKDFMKGYWIVSLGETESRPPALRGPGGEKISRNGMSATQIDNMFQGGYWYTVWGNAWHSLPKGFRVNGGLKACQLVRKDELLGGGGGIAEDDVDDVFGIEAGSGGFDPAGDDEL